MALKINLLPAKAQRIHRKLGEAVQETAEAIREGARETVAVDTGNLRGTIQVEEEENPLLRSVTAGGPSAESPEGADYAHYVELGTRQMAAQPYLTPAAEGERAAFTERCRKAVREGAEEG